MLVALNPAHAVHFFLGNGWHGFFVLGAVFLAITGCEALYADMGHFGTKPIQVTWFALVLPALVLNYFGQGTLVLSKPAAIENPFYMLAPSWAVLPMVALETAAACIASQAVISGAFSLTRQAVQLGFCPRLEIVHTSATEIGQIYVPAVNWGLMVSVIGIVLGFRTSSSLAAAYGIAVSSTMVITALLAVLVAMGLWKWRPQVAIPVFGLFLLVDVSFLSANALKIADGGWFPLFFAAGVFLLMTTWKRGRAILGQRLSEQALPLEMFLRSLEAEHARRVPGTAVFMTGNPEGTPPALLHHVKHSKVVHERVVLLNVRTADVPHIPTADRVDVEALGSGFFRVQARYGFMETPSVPKLIDALGRHGLVLETMDTSFFLGRETLIAAGNRGMSRWRKMLFAWMSKNARPATAYFGLPANRVVELGAQLEL